MVCAEMTEASTDGIAAIGVSLIQGFEDWLTTKSLADPLPSTR
jgi:hypothetical protein